MRRCCCLAQGVGLGLGSTRWKKGSNVAIKFNGCDFQSSDHRLSKERAMWYVEGVFMENNKSHNADEHGNN